MMEYFVAIIQNLEDTILSEISQSQKDKYYETLLLLSIISRSFGEEHMGS
jgi:hypothetical protein